MKIPLGVRWAGGLLLIPLAVLGWAYYRDKAPAGSPMGESVSPDEEYYTTRIISSAVGLSMTSRAELLDGKGKTATTAQTAPGFNPADYRRDVHAKSHGCVLAKFTVDKVDDRFAQGLLAQPGNYDAIIRFSSGKSELNPDSTRDARGFALKVLGVKGKKLLDFEQDDSTQDFIMINSSTFFIRTIADYAAFSSALGGGTYATIRYFFPSYWNPATWRPRQMLGAFGSFKAKPKSLVTERYYSLSAYALGAQNYVKYSARPCATNQAMVPANAGDAKISFDYLRLELANQAAKGTACFDFMVQPQIPGKNMPVEDATVEWSERDSPFVKVASVSVQAVPNNTAEMNQRCESLEFNPWHSLPAHRPVGVMNRVRKALYQGMAQFRRTKNCESFCSQKCAVGQDGQPCSDGCSTACMKGCPLLSDPVPAAMELPAASCRTALAVSEKADSAADARR